MGDDKRGGESKIKKKPQKPHVVAVPYVGQGHLIPFLELAKLLASHGLIVSFISTVANVARLQPQVDKVVKSSSLDIDIRLVSLSLPPIEGLPPGIESSENVPIHLNGILMTSSHKLAPVYQLRIAEQIGSSIDDVADEEVVKRAVIKLLAEEEGDNMRNRAGELRKKAKMAIEKGGSSDVNLQAFVGYMRELHDKGGGGSSPK